VNAADRVLLALDVPGESAADAIMARVGPQARGVRSASALLAAGPPPARLVVRRASSSI
jgi:hypothetical protein